MLNTAAVFELLVSLAEEEGIRVTVTQSAKGAAIAGGGAFIGGLLAGPPGVAVGATVGGLAGYWATSGRFQPLASVLRELPKGRRDDLLSQTMGLLTRLDISDAAVLASLLVSNMDVRTQVLAQLTLFATEKLNLVLVPS